MKRLSAARAMARLLRARASEAMVASTTPNRVDRQAISIEFEAARWIGRDATGSNSWAYHCSEKPVGGNFSVRFSVNEIITTTITGVTMIRTASRAMPQTTSE